MRRIAVIFNFETLRNLRVARINNKRIAPSVHFMIPLKVPTYFHFSTSDSAFFRLGFALSYTLIVIYERVSDVRALIACNLYAWVI